MELKITISILSILAIIILLLPFVYCSIERRKFLPPRCDRTNLTLQDRPLSDFKNMQSKDFSFYSKKVLLKGRFYFKDDINDKNVIIFCHGFGAGHEAYITEIDYYVNNGFVCVGFDYRGCKLSCGKTSHYGGSIQDLHALYNYLEKTEFLQDKNLYLWGHSWGGYTALMGSTLPKVKKVIAFCPFDKPLSTINRLTKKSLKGLSKIIKVYRFIYYKTKYGKYANLSGYDTISNGKASALIIFGGKDEFIGLVDYKFNSNVSTILCQDKAHNPYNTIEAENYLNQTILDYSSSTNKLDFLSKVDYIKITEQDKDLLEKTVDFLKN